MSTITLEKTLREVACMRHGKPSYRWAPAYYIVIDGVKEYPPVSRSEAYARKRELEHSRPQDETVSSAGIEVNCKSVVGGWQTQIVATGYLFGPVFNSVSDLWIWQKSNLWSKS